MFVNRGLPDRFELIRAAERLLVSLVSGASYIGRGFAARRHDKERTSSRRLFRQLNSLATMCSKNVSVMYVSLKDVDSHHLKINIRSSKGLARGGQSLA